MSHQEKKHQQRTIGGKARSVSLVAALGLASLMPGTALAGQTCPSPTAVPPLGSCHPSACTAGFCNRGDIAPLATPATQALQDRLVLPEARHTPEPEPAPGVAGPIGH